MTKMVIIMGPSARAVTVSRMVLILAVKITTLKRVLRLLGSQVTGKMPHKLTAREAAL